MKFFKMFGLTHSVSRTLILSVAASAVVVGCMKPSPRGTDPNGEFSDQTKSDINQTAATFFINGAVTGEAIVSKNVSGFSIPVEKQFTFRACIQDKRTNETIKGHKFNVAGAEAGTITVENGGRSDGSGCVNWTEKLAYNGLADSKFIPIKRVLIADGMHTGARELSICVNPWERTEAVRDCARSPVPETQLAKLSEIKTSLAGENPSGAKVDRFLWVNDMRLNSAHNPGGAGDGLIDFSVAMSPKVLRLNVRGEEDPMMLLDGVFSVKLWIVAKTGAGNLNNQCVVLAKSEPTAELKMLAGTLQEELKMKLQYLSTYGQLELVGEISPKENTVGLKPYNGVWILGDQSGLLGMKFGFPRPLSYKGEPGSFSAGKYVESCIDVSASALGTERSKALSLAPIPKPVTPTLGSLVDSKSVSIIGSTATVPAELLKNECVDAEDIPRLFPEDAIAKGFKGGSDLLSCINKSLPSGITKLEQFEFGLVDVRPEPIIDPLNTETTTERTIKYRVTTRVTNPLAQGAPLRDIEFTIERSDGSSDSVRTNHQGDLIFTDKVHHVYFAEERYILKVARIKHASGFSKRIAIVFNPWDNNGFTFARDLRGVQKQTVAQVNLVPRPKSELLLTQYQWGAQGFRYEVDNFMNLKMIKQFNVTLTPRVLRYSSLTDGRMRNEPLRDGVYVMKVAFHRDYRPLDGSPLEYVTVDEKLVRVASGIINTPIEMAFRDFRLLKIRSNLLIEIATIDELKLSPLQRKTLKYDGDINTLIDKSSGLAARTFIGPVVAYSNGFSASMRPTDDLSEKFCVTIDCGQLKKNDRVPPSEQSLEAKFNSSIKHLANVTVTDMIERKWQVLESKYQNEMRTAVKLSSITQKGNLELVRFKEDAASVKNDEALLRSNRAFGVGRTFAEFLKSISTIDPRQSLNLGAGQFERFAMPASSIEPAIKEVVENGTSIPKLLATRLCIVFVEKIVLQRDMMAERKLGQMGYTLASNSRKRLSETCIREVMRGNTEVFAIERKLRVLNLHDSQRRGGNLMFLSAGAGSSFGISQGQSFSYGFSPTSTVGGALKLGGFAMTEKFFDALGISVSYSRSESKSFGEDFSVGIGQSIAVELRGMRVIIDKYERCSSVRFSKGFLERNFEVINTAMPKDASAEARVSQMSRGVLFCLGETSSQPITVDERYYQFSQPIGDEALNDPTALENHPYLMTLRGRGDFARFVSIVEARQKTFDKFPKHVSIGDMPVERLMGAFQSAAPTAPGVITLDSLSIPDLTNVTVDPPISDR